MQQTPQVVPDPVEWLSKVLHRFWVILEGEVQPLTTGPPCCGHFLQEVRPFVLEGPHGFFPTQIPVNRIVRLQHGKIVGQAGNGEVQFLVPVSPCHLHASIVLKQVVIPLPNVCFPILQLTPTRLLGPQEARGHDHKASGTTGIDPAQVQLVCCRLLPPTPTRRPALHAPYSILRKPKQGPERTHPPRGFQRHSLRGFRVARGSAGFLHGEGSASHQEHSPGSALRLRLRPALPWSGTIPEAALSPSRRSVRHRHAIARHSAWRSVFLPDQVAPGIWLQGRAKRPNLCPSPPLQFTKKSAFARCMTPELGDYPNISRRDAWARTGPPGSSRRAGGFSLLFAPQQPRPAFGSLAVASSQKKLAFGTQQVLSTPRQKLRECPVDRRK